MTIVSVIIVGGDKSSTFLLLHSLTLPSQPPSQL